MAVDWRGLARYSSMAMSTKPASKPDRPDAPRDASVWPAILPAALVLLLSVSAFGQVVGFEFLRWDDWYMIQENPRLMNPTGANLLQFWAETDTGYKALYTPLSYSVMWVLARMVGLRPGVFHAANLVVHLINVVLVMLLTWRLLHREVIGWRRGLLVAMAGALFAVHPAQVEAVAWASSLNTLLACCFGLLAVCAWAMIGGNGIGKGILRLGITAMAVLLACLCKPSAVVLPLVIAAIDLLVMRGGWARAAIALIVLSCVVAPLAAIATSIQPATDVASPMLWRPVIMLDALGFYGAHLLAPVRIVADYGRTPDFVAANWLKQPYWVCGVLLLGLAGLMWKRRPMLSAALAVFVLTLLPVSGLTVFQFQTFSTVADRYLYLPLAMAIPIGMLLLVDLQPRLLAIGLVCLSGSLAVICSAAMPMWRDTLTWANALIERNPASPAGYFVLAEHQSRLGDEAGAEKLYLKCLELRPGSIEYLYNLGNVRMRQQRYAEALGLYVRAMDAGARTVDVYNNAFVAAQKAGQLSELAGALERVLGRDSGNAPAHAYYGWLLLMAGRVGEAQAHFRTSLEIMPGLPAAAQGMQKIGVMQP